MFICLFCFVCSPIICPICRSIENICFPFFAAGCGQTKTGCGPSHPADAPQPGAGNGLLADPAATLHLKDFRLARPLPGLDFGKPGGCFIFCVISSEELPAATVVSCTFCGNQRDNLCHSLNQKSHLCKFPCALVIYHLDLRGLGERDKILHFS